MTQATTTTTTATDTNGNGNGKAKREPKEIGAIDALSKIKKILDQLSDGDKKRVLAFLNEPSA